MHTELKVLSIEGCPRFHEEWTKEFGKFYFTKTVSRLIKILCGLLIAGMFTAVKMPANASDAYKGSMIDAHAQFDHKISPDEIIDILKQAGISRIVPSPIYR